MRLAAGLYSETYQTGLASAQELGALMLLAVDIGNTNIVIGAFVSNDLTARWRIATDARRMPDEYAVLLESLFSLGRLDLHEIGGVVLSGVVPPVQAAMCDAVRQLLGLDPLIISRSLQLGIEVRAQNAGADRIANAVAARERFGTPAIVVDFGTTTNFDVVSADGAYVGGALAPGLEVSEEALAARTAQLPRVPLEAPATAIAGNTVEALQSGILFGYAGLVDGLVDRIQSELGAKARVIATGGLGAVIAPHTRTVTDVEPDLTLHGLRLIYLLNRI